MPPTDHPCPDADLWILAGQSNMQGCAPFGESSEIFTPHPRLWAFGPDYVWAPAAPPLHHLWCASDPAHRKALIEMDPEIDLAELDRMAALGRAGTPHIAGPGCFFGRVLLDHLPGDHTLALLPCAHGGSSLDMWSPERPGAPGETLYNAMLKRWRASGLRPKGMLWYQGESDAAPEAAATYRERFLHFAECLRRDLDAPDLPILTVQIGRVTQWDASSAWDAMRAAQLTVAREAPDVEMAATLDLELTDLIHLALPAQQALGERLARLALTHVYRIGPMGATIQPRSIEVQTDELGNEIRVAFDGVMGALRATGRPVGFQLMLDPAPDPQLDLFRARFDPARPDTVVLDTPPTAPGTRLGIAYGVGVNPTCNVLDGAAMALPAFKLWAG